MNATFTPEELRTLLGRPVRQLLTAADRRAFRGRRVLITGAGGSIGSALARAVAACRPATLTLVDHSERHLFEIGQALDGEAPGVAADLQLADVSRPALVQRVWRTAAPEVVFHAAAYKHVAMLEGDVCAAVAVNVLGTAHVARATRAAGARLVLVSSDKAAAPRSVMGASKRLAELVALAAAGEHFRPIVVRFGNVLGSSGSLLTILRDRIRQGRPLPITDPDATRYFMTADEAVSLVMKADRVARRPEIYWLDMGAPVAIGDLADRLLVLEARAGYPPVPIEVIGLRPGEKRREELAAQGLRLMATSHRRLWVARQGPTDSLRIRRVIERLRPAVEEGDARQVLELLVTAVPGYVPSDLAGQLAARQSPPARRAAWSRTA
ncbi:MAG: polysaccharide biosynthesis protein [Vicinamibacterales bacterium]